MTKVQEINNKIEKLYKEIETIEEKCDHKNKTMTYRSNTGNYDPHEDCYWREYSCPTCEKLWREEGHR